MMSQVPRPLGLSWQYVAYGRGAALASFIEGDEAAADIIDYLCDLLVDVLDERGIPMPPESEIGPPIRRADVDALHARLRSQRA